MLSTGWGTDCASTVRIDTAMTALAAEPHTTLRGEFIFISCLLWFS
jgi:hypothetical protein